MKAICIKEATKNTHNIPNLPTPKVGEEVTVIAEQYMYEGFYYHIEEYPEYQGHRLWYNVNNFALPSDLDETDLVNEEFNEKYCVPVNDAR